MAEGDLNGAVVMHTNVTALREERERSKRGFEQLNSRLQVADGSYRTMSGRASPILDAQGEVDFWVGIELDITDLKDVEAAPRISHKELETFSYAVAHDLRSPPAVIDGFSRLLEKELGEAATPRAAHLLGNAWKFTAQTAQAQISFTASPDPAMPAFLIYHIEDNGAGFDMDHTDKLFKPFQRLHSAQDFEGTGIGLATVKKIVQRHGGWITASAERGKGATFDFSLGAHAAAPTPARQP